MRRCKNKCGNELPTVKKCETIFQRKGYCDIDCLAADTRAKNVVKEAKKKARQFKEMKDRVESQGSKSKLMTRAQASFNAYIRERDANQPCISCSTTKVVDGGYIGAGGWDAGHYRSRGATPELRFNEDNCFKQCVSCNRDNSGNVVNMRIGIMFRIGEKRLTRVEGPHPAKKYTADDLHSIDKEYKNKLKQLQHDRG
jgi:hypothetical protein